MFVSVDGGIMVKKIFAAFIVFSSIIVNANICAASKASVKVSGESSSKSQEKKVSRIVCLNPAGFEILCEIGSEDLVVAKNEYCNYPAKNEIPVAGGFDGKSINIEKILAFKPDFVYGAKGMHDFLKSAAKNFNFELFLSDAVSIDAILDEIIFIGKKTGKVAQSEKLASEMKNFIENAKAKIAASISDSISASVSASSEKNAGNKKTVYWETWNSPCMSIGNKTFISEIIEIAGGRNIFAEINAAYPIVSEESILAKNPSVIILQSGTPETAEKIKQRPLWENIDAVKNNRIYVADSDIFTRSGPRIIEAIKILSGWLGN